MPTDIYIGDIATQTAKTLESAYTELLKIPPFFT